MIGDAAHRSCAASSRPLGLLATLAAMALAGTGASAQSSETGPSQPVQLSPVVVTVTRGVEQRAFDAPASVDVIDKSVLRRVSIWPLRPGSRSCGGRFLRFTAIHRAG